MDKRPPDRPAAPVTLDAAAVEPRLPTFRVVPIPGFWMTHLVLPLIAFAIALIAFQTTALDLDLANAWAYDYAHHRWIGRGTWWADVLLHRDGRDAMLLLVAGLLAVLAAAPWSARARAARGTALYLLCAIALSWGLVGLLKHATNLPCPWDLRDFGGDRPHVGLFDVRPDGYARAACYPGAHSASGYSLFAFYFAWCRRRRQLAWIALAVALVVGSTFAFAQEARGAHLVSHDVTSAFIAWFVALGTFVGWRLRTGIRSEHT